ncbi:hypothetical protein ADK38_06815, partial [Streptomyces varsoviensis]
MPPNPGDPRGRTSVGQVREITVLTRSSLKDASAADPLDLEPGPAGQQPQWPDAALARRVRGQLATLPGLLDIDEVLALRTRLAAVAAGAALVIQA